ATALGNFVVAAGFVAIEGHEFIRDFAPSFFRIQIAKQRQIRLGHQVKSAIATSDGLMGIDMTAKRLDGDDEERGRGEQSRREQTASGMPRGVANAEPCNTP